MKTQTVETYMYTLYICEHGDGLKALKLSVIVLIFFTLFSLIS